MKFIKLVGDIIMTLFVPPLPLVPHIRILNSNSYREATQTLCDIIIIL